MDQINYDKTPKKLLFNGLGTKKTPISTPKNFTTRFLLLSNNNSTLSPSPSLKNRVVRNPFEHQLHEKLHLPVISSPSLFHAPTTPKNNTNKLELFEWTIEEISNLNPVNLVAHESQFSEDIDPIKEAQTQAAITSFFNEQKVVPSPMNSCPFGRRKKIELKNEISMNIYNSTALPETENNILGCHINKRDISTQTALSFPPNLPKEIEDLLKKFQTNDDCNKNTDSVSNDVDELETSCSNNNRSVMDISTLRRKLFINRPETPEISDDTFAISINLSPAPKTPELSRSRLISHSKIHDERALQGNDTINSDLFGELSPIGNFDSSNSSPIMSSSFQDISMTSDVGRDQTPASRHRRCNKLKKKRLSESFICLQNELNNESLSDDKENINHNEYQAMSKNNKPILLQRFDSGFDSSSHMLMNCSTEFMQI